VAMTSATAVALANGRLAVLDGTQVKLVNLGNPATPTVVSTTSSAGAQRVDGAGTWIYLASPQVDPTTRTAGLYVCDVSIPTAPRIAANVYTAYDNSATAVAGSLAVVTAPNGLGLKVVNVSVAAAPRVVGALSGSTLVGAAMAGAYAYVLQVVPGNPARTDLATVSLTNPAAPAIVGRTTLAGGADVEVVGSFAYVAAGAAGLQIVNVSNPAAPAVVRTVDTPGLAKDVAVAGGYAYVADGTSLKVVNVTTPSAAAVIGSLPMTAAAALTIVNTRAFVLDGSTQFKVVDVATPTAPRLLSTTSSYGAQRVAALGNRAFLATPALNHSDPSGGLYILDTSNALQPLLRNQVVVPGTIHSVAATATYVFTGDGSAVLDVIRP
jgi:hypothetical protein